MTSTKWKMILVLLFVFMVGGAIVFSPIFALHSIKVDDNYYIQKNQIMEKINLQRGSNLFVLLLEQRGVLDMRLFDTEKNLESIFPYMDHVRVHVILPNTLGITYQEKQEAYQIPYGNTYLITDKNGFILRSNNKPEKNMLQLNGIRPTSFSIGKRIDGYQDHFEKARLIYDEIHRYDTTYLTAFREYIDWIDVSRDDMIVIRYDDRITVRLDIANDLSYQAASMCVILSEKVGPKEKGILDFHYQNPVFSPE